jgi:hypothetical protein
MINMLIALAAFGALGIAVVAFFRERIIAGCPPASVPGAGAPQ